MAESIDFLYINSQDFVDDKLHFLDYASLMIDTSTYTKRVRHQLGLSQEKFAELLECTKGNVSAWENNRHQPKLRDLQKMHQLINGAIPPPFDVNQQADSFDGMAGLDPTTKQVVELMRPLSAVQKAVVYGAVVGAIAGMASTEKSPKKASA